MFIGRTDLQKQSDQPKQPASVILDPLSSGYPDRRQLWSDQPSRSLRWTLEPGLSYRVYEIHEQNGGHFCVSTRSTELTLVLEGELWVELGPARQQLRVLAGQGVLVSCGTPHLLHLSPGSRFLVLDLPRVPFSGLGAVALGSADIPLALLTLTPRLCEQRQTLASSELPRLVEELARHERSDSYMALEPCHSTKRMLEIKAALEVLYSQEITLEEVARSFGLDRFYLLRRFKESFGVTPGAYLQFLRLEHFVWSMLLGDERDLIAVAGEAGFNDYSTFCRRMRRMFGAPPSRLVHRQGSPVLP